MAALNRDQKKGRHELRRKLNRERMRRHRLTIEGKVGPEGKDLAHHHGFHKLTKTQIKAAALAEEKANASNEVQAVGFIEGPKTEGV